MNVIFTRSALAVMAVAHAAAVTPREPVTLVEWASANMVSPSHSSLIVASTNGAGGFEIDLREPQTGDDTQ
jgi:hypothetical protein